MNIAHAMTEMFDRMFRERVFRAVVTGVSGNLVTIKRTGQTNADTQSYPALASYTTPTASDEVLVVKLGDGWIVVGKVIR